MKDFDAMLLSVVRARTRAGRGAASGRSCSASPPTRRPAATRAPRCSSSDHAEQLAHCTEAVGEVGGFSTTVRGQRLYLIEAAEKGMAWMRLTARGRAGHGSMINDDNAVTRLTAAVARIGAHEWPVRLTPTMQTLLAAVAELAGTEATPENAEALVEEFGGAARMLGAVHPQHHQPDDARRRLQGERDPHRGDRPRRRPVPARLRGRVLRHPRRAVRRGHRAIDYLSHQQPWETPYDGDLVDAMTRSLLAEDPDAIVAPYLMSGGTDAKHFNKLGMRCYGFAPLRLPADLDFTALFHGVDERVPVDALEFGARVFDRFLDEV